VRKAVELIVDGTPAHIACLRSSGLVEGRARPGGGDEWYATPTGQETASGAAAAGVADV
jgi:hypothetical protein